MTIEIPEISDNSNDNSNQASREALTSEAATLAITAAGSALIVGARQALSRGVDNAPVPSTDARPQQPSTNPRGDNAPTPSTGTLPPVRPGNPRGDNAPSPSTGGRPPEQPNPRGDLPRVTPLENPPSRRGSQQTERPRDSSDPSDQLRQMLDNRLDERIPNERHRTPDTDFRVTPEDRTRAKQVLANELSELIPQADRDLMRNLQSAVIDGNLDQLRTTLRTLSADPAKLNRFIEALNRQFSRHEVFNGIELGRDGQGNVLLYKEKGNTALSINPTTGDASVRAIEVQADGSVLLRPGEIINRQPAEVLQAVGDEATRAVVGPRFQHRLPDYGLPDRLYNYKQRPLQNGSRSQMESIAESIGQMLGTTNTTRPPASAPSINRPR